MTPWVLQLLLLNGVAFVATAVVPGLFTSLMLVPALLAARPWTLLTYMFLHGDLLHLLFNMIALFFFGPRLEVRLGAKHFLGLYFVSGVAGALLSFLFTPQAAIVGASGAVFGVLLAFAMYWPRERIFIWGVLPIESRWLVALLTVASLWGGFGGQAGGIAHFAHLGGFLGGWLYLKVRERASAGHRFKKKAAPAGARLGDRATLDRFRRIDPEGLHEVNRAEYRRIAGKIEEEGVGSLSERERTFIDRFSPG